ncbi:MAG: NAD(P)-binding domain-containing protein, partial [Chloroflexi bacterium]|nr:NAD(P)-binding domain-containing protein [Chloroflexota bacterium]
MTNGLTDYPTIALIGGTGKQGTALAARFAKAGVRVLIGSRDAARAENAAREINARLSVTNIGGYSNRDAAARAEIILLALPYKGMQPILEDIRGAVQNKIVINIASSLDPERKSRARVVPAGSITQELQNFFGNTARVVAAFQNISPEKLEGDAKIDADVL